MIAVVATAMLSTSPALLGPDSFLCADMESTTIGDRRPSCGLSLEGHVGGSAAALALDGDRAFVAVGPRLMEVDWSRPDDGVVEASEVLDSSLTDVAVSLGRLYALTDRGTLVRMDRTEGPGSGFEYHVEAEGYFDALEADDERVYLVDFLLPGLRVYEIGRGGALSASYEIVVQAHVLDLALHDGTVYMLGEAITAIDVTRAGDPHELWSAESVSVVRDVVLDGAYLYAATDAGILRGRIGGDEPPVLEEWYESSGPALSVTSGDDLIYAGVYNGGLVALEDGPDNRGRPVGVVGRWRTPLRVQHARAGAILVLDAYEGLFVVRGGTMAVSAVGSLPVMSAYDVVRGGDELITAGFYSGMM